MADGRFKVISAEGTVLFAPAVIIAGGLGSFEPRKPPIANIVDYEVNGVDYFVRDPEKYRDRRIVVAGGGDSALDWTIFLADVAKEVVMIHRRTEFRGAPDSVEKVLELADKGKITLVTTAQVVDLKGEGKLESVVIEHDTKGRFDVKTDYFIPLFGLTPKLGPIAEWGMQIENGAIKVNVADYSSSVEGIFAVGDINTYPGKLKLILCGFHEGTMAVQSAFKIVHPGKKLSFKYTTVTGIEGIPAETPATT
jgi:thioredoxin reductase (NADPH)